MILGTFKGIRVDYDPERDIFNFEGDRFGTGGMAGDEVRGVRDALEGIDSQWAAETFKIVDAAVRAAATLKEAKT